MASAARVEFQRIQQEEMRRLVDGERIVLERDFGVFFREAWKVLNPFTPLHECRYIDVIAEYLAAVELGQITRLIINQPPRTGKSSLVSIAFPCWSWTRNPQRKFLFYTYSFEQLSVPFSVQRRRLIQSNWFQEHWRGRFFLSYDENMKWSFSNSKTGFMTVVTGATGKGGDCVVIDDPHSVEEALSDVEREAGVTKVREALMSRLDNPESGAIVVVMQRLNENDVTGSLLKDGNWKHLCLPAEAEKAQEISLPVSNKVWKRPAGDLLDPVRLSLEVLNGKKLELGARAAAGQYQQEPAPASGTIFQTDWWEWYEPDKPPEFEQVVVSVDASFKGKETSSDVAVHKYGMVGIRSYLIRRDTRKMGFAATKAAIRAMVKEEPKAEYVLIEDKANGTAIIEELQSEFTVIAIDPGFGDKVARAEGCSPMVEAHTAYLPKNSDGVLIQIRAAKFPNAEKDDIDAFTQFMNWRRKRGASMEWFKLAAKKADAERAGAPEAQVVEHPTPQQVQRLAMEEAGMTVRPTLTKPVKAGELKKDAPRVCPDCGGGLFVSSKGAKCLGCGKVMPARLRETNIG